MYTAVSSVATVEPTRRLRGRLRVPGDKSISHRYAMLAALARGTSTIKGYSTGGDCQSTLSCLRALGVRVTSITNGKGIGQNVSIIGHGLSSFVAPSEPINAGNSGTTMRLLAGILAGHRFETIITGDASLRRRPMRRIIEPLERMGARLDAANGQPPLTIKGDELDGIDYTPPVASAQVKSAVLLAGIQANGVTYIREPTPTRDHTERALSAFGAEIEFGDDAIAVTGGASLNPINVAVPGDLSSAAFWIAAAAVIPGSDVTISSVGLNPTRSAYLDILRKAGADIEIDIEKTIAGEPLGSIRVRSRPLSHITITATDVPGLIDELPVLGALGVHGSGVHLSGATELRNKESDRITAFANGLRALGADVEEHEDGFRITNSGKLRGGTADAVGDHRLAMAFTIAALGADKPSTITSAAAVDVSYPDFFEVLDSLRQ